MFAYLRRSYMVWTYVVRKGKLINIAYALNSDGSIKIFQKKYLVPTLLKILRNNLENGHNIFKEYCEGWTCSYKEIILTTTKSPTKI